MKKGRRRSAKGGRREQGRRIKEVQKVGGDDKSCWKGKMQTKKM